MGKGLIKFLGLGAISKMLLFGMSLEANCPTKEEYSEMANYLDETRYESLSSDTINLKKYNEYTFPWRGD